MSNIINLAHIFVFAPLLIFIATYPEYNTVTVQWILLITAIAMGLYHGSKAWRTHHWVNIFHVLVVAPIMIALSWQGTSITPNVKQMTMLLALGAIAYHSWRLVSRNL